MKICTDIKQGYKLLELGIPIESADMFWDLLVPEDKRTPTVGNPSEYDDIENSFVPAWSLAALLELMPHCITGWDGLEYTRITKGNILEYSNQESGYRSSLISIPSNNLLSPAYNMIIWLKENKYI